MLDRQLDEAAVGEDVRLDTPGRTVVVAALTIGIPVGGGVGATHLLLDGKQSTLAGLGTFAMAIGLSQLGGAALLWRWERRHGESVAVVDGELVRLAAAPR